MLKKLLYIIKIFSKVTILIVLYIFIRINCLGEHKRLLNKRGNLTDPKPLNSSTGGPLWMYCNFLILIQFKDEMCTFFM